jgi:hypothetical protein
MRAVGPLLYGATWGRFAGAFIVSFPHMPFCLLSVIGLVL